MKACQVALVALLSLLTFFALFSFGLLIGVSFGDEKPTPSVEERIYKIADDITKEGAGLLAVPYAEAPEHYIQQGEKKIIHYGVHYNVFITKRADKFTDDDFKKTLELVGKLMKLTTKEVLAKEQNFTHMGVQIVDPNAWSYGGHERGSIIVLEATKARLMQMPDEAPLSNWPFLASVNPQVIVPENYLKYLLQNQKKN